MKEIEELLNVGREAIKQSVKKDFILFELFLKVHAKYFSGSEAYCSGCPSGYDRAYSQMELFYNKQKNKTMIETTKSNFVLKGCGSVYSIADHKHYTNNNMTDAIALGLLKSNENYIGAFAKYPKNWRELLVDLSADFIVVDVPIEVVNASDHILNYSNTSTSFNRGKRRRNK